jgi:tripartite-type tricarboxylate transporter receptor subunit TctC
MSKETRVFKPSLAIGAACLFASTLSAHAQTYPSKPVRVIATSTAGGPLDVFTRLVANKMEERLKQPVVVESRGGAGGNIAASAVMGAPPDGYTVLSSIDTTFTVNPSLFKQIPFDPEKDFIPVSVLAKFGQILAVHPDLPVKSVKELLELSRQKDLNYGSAGNGLPSHLSFAYLQAITGIRANHVPYKGNPPTLLALMSGDVHAAMVISTSILPHAKAGKIRMLAYSDSTRSEVVPNVPTIAEEGYQGFEVVFAYVLLAPAGTPQAIIDTLHAESTRAVMSPDVRDKLRGVDTVPIALSPVDSAAWLRANRQKWTDVVKRMNIRVD